MKKKINKMVSLLLTMMIIIEILPMSVWAENYNNQQNVLNVKIESEEKDKTNIIGELVEKRTANQKVYIREDGSYTTVISSGPINYFENNKWKEIDNTLVEYNGVITNESNSFSVEFPKETSSNNNIVLSSGDTELSFAMNDVLPSEADITSKEINENDLLPTVDSSIEYSDILLNTDLKYEVGADSVKESIILNAIPDSDTSYSYNLRSEGNTITLNEDGSVTISKDDDVLFEIQKPFMFDENNAFSDDITTTLVNKNDGTYTLTYTPDYEWLSSSERVYPITIDPTTRINQLNGIVDALVGNYNIADEILQSYYCIRKNNNEESKLYLKLDNGFLSVLGNNIVITKAELSMYCRAEENQDSLGVYAINENWTEGTTTEVTKDNEILDYNIIESSESLKRYAWDITEAASEWIIDQRTNNGIVIEAIDDNSCSTSIKRSSSSVTTSHRPWFEIDYINTNNYTNSNSETIDMGRAGTLYLNKYTGTYYVQRTDLSLNGNISPVTMSFSFDPWSSSRPTNSIYGSGWYTDYFNKLFYSSTVVEDNVTRHQYTLHDSLGISTKFSEVLPSDEDYEDIPESFTAANIDNYTRYKAVFGNFDKCLWVPKTDTTHRDFANMIIEDSDYFYTIDSIQRVVRKTSKENRGYIEITPYTAESNAIGSVTDGVGRKYTMTTFRDSNNKLLVDKLVVYNNANNLIQVNTASGNVAVGVDYSYQPVNSNKAYLTGITYPDGESIAYEYNSEGKITSITNVDGSRLELTYTNGRVTGYTKYAYYVSANSSQNCPEIRYEATFDSAKQRTYRYYEYGSSIPTQVIRQKYDDTLTPTDSINLNGEFSYTQSKTENDVETTSFSSNDNSATNLLLNGTFENSSNWIMIPGTKVSADNYTNTNDFSTTDNKVCRMNGGGNGTNIRASQTIATLNANTEDKVYTVSAWAKSENACANNYAHDYSQIDKTFALCVLDADNNVLAQYDYDTECDEWQFGAVSFKTTDDLSNVKVVLSFDNQSTSSVAVFDSVKFYETENSYVYTDEEEINTASTDLFITINGITYRTEPCDSCSCAQCTTPVKVTVDGIEQNVYYNCSCDSDDENNNCDCLGCRQERSHSTTTNSYGLTTKESQTYNGKELYTEYNYSDDCNYLASVSDGDGNSVYYNYNADTGFLDSFGYEENNGEIINPVIYSYNAVGALTSVSQIATDLNNNTLNLKSDYSYNGDRLTSVSHSGISYTFDYDHYGNTTSTKVNGNTIISYTYPDHQNVGSITYANGLTISYTYDNDKNITSIKYNNVEKFAYEYTDGVLSKSVDYANMLVTYYTDDTTTTKLFTLSGNDIVDGDTVYIYNSETDTETIFGVTYSLSEETQVYNGDDTVTSSETLSFDNKSLLLESTTDFFNRAVDKKLTFSNGNDASTELLTEYTYADTSTTASNTVTGVENKLNGTTVSNYTYTYDNAGNITEIRNGTTLANKYVYDEAGQLIREYDFINHKATEYLYDANGNILSKTPYTNVTGTDLSTATQGTAITYSYDTSWTDKLISYNGQSIVYDSIGNPTTYRGATLIWNGRLLTSYEKGSDRYEYSYNEDGLRVEKKYYFNNVLQNICTYVWENGKLIAQKQFNCTNNDYLTITYLYDGEEAIGFVYDGLTFYYIKNIQGDVTAIAIADSGKLALTISYDAWGNPEYSIVVDDNAGVWEKLAAFLRAAGIMGLNNYTYRGYFYDTETGLYYLQSRYYDPEVGRFINLDETSIAAVTTGEILGTSLFAYCCNDPVNRIDTSGFISDLIVIDGLYGNIYRYVYFQKRDSKIKITIDKNTIYAKWSSKGIITIDNKNAGVRNIISKGKTMALADAIYTIGKSFERYSFRGRTVKGLAFELLCHYIWYSKGIIKKHTDICDMGGTGRFDKDFDSNAAVFERHRDKFSKIQEYVKTGNLNKATANIAGVLAETCIASLWSKID